MERKKLGKLGSIGAGGLAILSVAGCGGGEVDSEKINFPTSSPESTRIFVPENSPALGSAISTAPTELSTPEPTPEILSTNKRINFEGMSMTVAGWRDNVNPDELDYLSIYSSSNTKQRLVSVDVVFWNLNDKNKNLADLFDGYDNYSPAIFDANGKRIYELFADNNIFLRKHMIAPNTGMPVRLYAPVENSISEFGIGLFPEVPHVENPNGVFKGDDGYSYFANTESLIFNREVSSQIDLVNENAIVHPKGTDVAVGSNYSFKFMGLEQGYITTPYRLPRFAQWVNLQVTNISGDERNTSGSEFDFRLYTEDGHMYEIMGVIGADNPNNNPGDTYEFEAVFYIEDWNNVWQTIATEAPIKNFENGEHILVGYRGSSSAIWSNK